MPDWREPLPLTPAKIRELRLEAGLTQQQLAAVMDVTRETVSNWETGRYKFDADDWKKVLRFLAAAASWKIAESDEGPWTLVGEGDNQFSPDVNHAVIWTRGEDGYPIIVIAAVKRAWWEKVAHRVDKWD